jgi:hypothetical protein
LPTTLGTATLASPPASALLDHFRPKPIVIAALEDGFVDAEHSLLTKIREWAT